MTRHEPTMHPRSTYRLQVRASFDLDAAADLVPYLRDLGADWVYLSPILAVNTLAGIRVASKKAYCRGWFPSRLWPIIRLLSHWRV